jgi:acyl-CoA synthetase (AMP-forming)/AMP-acid ligase II
LAATRIGAIAIPINTFSRARELVWLLRHSDVQVLLTCDRYLSHDYLARLEEGIEELSSADGPELYLQAVPMLRRAFVWGEASRSWTRPGPKELENRPAENAGPSKELLSELEGEVDPSDPAILIYTSGSTAEPKGVVHSHGTMVRQSAVVAEMREITSEDRLYLNMPFFWVGGFLMGPLSTLQTGACLHCDSLISEEEILQLLIKERITRLSSGFPSTAALKVHPQFDAVAHAHVREFSEGGLTRVFGMTESFGWHSAERMGAPNPSNSMGSMGRAVPGIERRIVDPETGQPQAPGEGGELVLSGRNLMLGYYKRAPEDVFEADGSFRTGDGCRIEADGSIYFEGRLDEMIRSRGTNVAPAEIEGVLHAMPDVKRAAIVGLPDADRGERVVAVVVATTGSVLTPELLRERMRGELASYKVPAEIVILGESDLPLGPTQKVLKPRLKELLQSRDGGLV